MEDKPIPVEDDIKVLGVHNPMTLVILGFPAPYTLEAIKRAKKTIEYVVIVEPNLETFKSYLRRYPIRQYLQDEKIDFLVGIPIDEIFIPLYNVLTKPDHRYGTRTLRTMNPEMVYDPFAYPPKDKQLHPLALKLKETIRDCSMQLTTAMGCASDSMYRWDQLWRNEKSLMECYNMSPLINQFKDMPTIVIGGGPSADEFIELCKKEHFQNKALIIAVDSVLVKLLKNGIRPHLVTRCERKLTDILNGAEDFDLHGIYFCAFPWISPEYFELFPDKFMLFRSNGVCDFTGFSHIKVNCGVSSGNAALELAYMLGSKNIVMTGIDLAFIDGKSHAEGTAVEFDPKKSKSKWLTVKANDGSEVTTIPIWYRCKGEFEGGIQKFKELGITLINTSGKGAYIHGAKYMPWRELSFSLPADPLSKIRALARFPGKEEQARFDGIKKEALKLMRDAERNTERQIGFLKDGWLTSSREEERMLMELECYKSPATFWTAIAKMEKNLFRLYSEPCRQIDEYRKRWYNDKLFSQLIVDMCQVNIVSTENSCAGVVNTMKVESERLKHYILAHQQLLHLFLWYLRAHIDLLEGKTPIAVTRVTQDDLLSQTRSFFVKASEWEFRQVKQMEQAS